MRLKIQWFDMRSATPTYAEEHPKLTVDSAPALGSGGHGRHFFYFITPHSEEVHSRSRTSSTRDVRDRARKNRMGQL